MAYTRTPFKTKTTIGNIGPMRRDANNVPLQGIIGNYMQTIDATGTPATSPLTVNTTQTLVVPAGACSVIFVSTTNAVQISEDSTMTAYFLLPAGVPWIFDCSNMANIYLKVVSSTAVSFYFNML